MYKHTLKIQILFIIDNVILQQRSLWDAVFSGFVQQAYVNTKIFNKIVNHIVNFGQTLLKMMYAKIINTININQYTVNSGKIDSKFFKTKYKSTKNNNKITSTNCNCFSS